MSQTVMKTIVIRITPGGIQVHHQVLFSWELNNWPPADTFQKQEADRVPVHALS